MASSRLPPLSKSLTGSLLAAREAVMAPIRPHLRAVNITEPQWRVLRVLDNAGELNAGDIADLAMLHSPSVSRIVKELSERQLINCKVDPRDARKLSVTITEHGTDTVSHTSEVIHGILRTYFEQFGEDRLNAFAAEALALAEALRLRKT